jgi:hypothetical protein
MFGGDFMQVLPAVGQGFGAAIVESSIKSSSLYLCNKKKAKLTQSMRTGEE